MPAFDTNTPTTDAEFVGVKLKSPAPFTAAHALTELEAKFLNRAVTSTVGNQYAGDVRRAVEALNVDRIKAAITGPKQEAALAAYAKSKTLPASVTPATVADLGWDHQAKYNEKYSGYTLGVNNRGDGTGATNADPVASFMRALATEEVNTAIKGHGLKVPTFQAHKEADGRSRHAHLVDDYIAQNPGLKDIATAQVAAMQAAKEQAAAQATGSLDLTLPTSTPAPALEGAQ